MFLILALAGCATPKHQQGGSASTQMPMLANQSFTQPENPEGSSKIAFEERNTKHHPDGTIEINERKSATEIGGSQDLATIIKEAARAGMLRNAIVGLFLLLLGVVAISQGWPIVGAVVLAGGVSAFWLWWIGLAVTGVGAAIVFGYKFKEAET